MKTVRLTTCDTAEQAHILKGALESEGIPCLLHNEHTAGVLRGFTPTLAGVDLFVPETELENARALLETNRTEAEQEFCCPHCGSHEVETVFQKRGLWKLLPAFILSLMCTTPPGNNYFEYRCKHCGKRF